MFNEHGSTLKKQNKIIVCDKVSISLFNES